MSRCNQRCKASPEILLKNANLGKTRQGNSTSILSPSQGQECVCGFGSVWDETYTQQMQGCLVLHWREFNEQKNTS